MRPPRSAVITSSLFLLPHLSNALLLRSTDKCAPGEYWCQDRCGSDSYGQTCCQTPDGQHNLCGAGTICCLFGCCPSGSVCNTVGGCDSPKASGWHSSPDMPSGNASLPSPTTSSCGKVQTVTVRSVTQLTRSWSNLNFRYTTVTVTTSCPGNSSTTAPGQGTTITEPTTPGQTGGQTGGPTGGTTITDQPPASPTTWTDGNGGTFVSSASVIIINGTRTISVPSVTSPVTITTLNHTFTFNPSPPQTSPLPSSQTTSSVLTTTGSGGQPITSSGGVVIIGTTTFTLPTVTAPSTWITDGATFTLLPPSGTTILPSGPLTSTLSDGRTMISSSGVIVIGTTTFTLPSVTSPTVITTADLTFTLTPPGTGAGPTSPSTPSPSVTTLPDGGIFTPPIVTAPSTITTGGTVITVLPPSPSPSLTSVITLPDGNTFTLPSVTVPSTITTGGTTITVSPPGSPTTTPPPTSTPVTVTLPDGNTFTLPSVTAPTTITTGGTTLTISPSETPTTTPSVTTLHNGSSFTFPCVTATTSISTGGTIITIVPGLPGCTGQLPTTGPTPSVTTLPDGSQFTFPCVTATTSVSTGGAIITLVPGLPGCTGVVPTTILPPSPSVTTLPNGSPFTFPCVTSSTTLSTGGAVITVTPGIIGCITLGPTTTPAPTTDLPTFTTWPQIELIPVTTSVGEDEPQPTEGGGKSTCRLWFFFVCIDWGDIHILGWQWKFPPGVYPPCLGPGSCPPISWPPNIRIEGTLPPWPTITIGNDGKPTPSNEPTSCETTSATLRAFSTSYGVTTEPTTTRTTTTNIQSTSAVILGCNVRDAETTRTTTSVAECTLAPNNLAARHTSNSIDFKCEDKSDKTYAIYLKEDYREDDARQPIKDLLERRQKETRAVTENGSNERLYYEVRSVKFKTTYFYYGYKMSEAVADWFKGRDEIAKVLLVDTTQSTVKGSMSTEDSTGVEYSFDLHEESNNTSRSHSSMKRAIKITSQQKNTWERSQISVPPDRNWYEVDEDGDPTYVDSFGGTTVYNSWWDDSYGAGQTIYVLDEDFLPTHNEFLNNPPKDKLKTNGFDPPWDGRTSTHGTAVASCAVGKDIGIAREAAWVIAGFQKNQHSYLEITVKVADHIDSSKIPLGTATIVMTTGVYADDDDDEPWKEAMLHILQRLDSDLKTVIAVAAGNKEKATDPDTIEHWPAKFGIDGKMDNMIVVGASDINGLRWNRSPAVDKIDTYAPGVDSYVALSPGPSGGASTGSSLYNLVSGTSLSAPRVAGLAAYFRAIPSGWEGRGDLKEPRNVKALITKLHRKFDPALNEFQGEDAAEKWKNKYSGGEPEAQPVIWNGQSFDKDTPTNCFENPNILQSSSRRRRGTPLKRQQDDEESEGASCPAMPRDLDDLPLHNGETVAPGSLQIPPTAPPRPTSSKTTTDMGCWWTTTVTECNGSGGRQACITRPTCTTPPATAFPTITTAPKPTMTIPGSTCLSTVVTGSCNLGVGVGHPPACVSSTTCASWASSWAPPKPTGGFWLTWVKVEGETDIAAVADDWSGCETQQKRGSVIQYSVVQDTRDGLGDGLTLQNNRVYQLSTLAMAGNFPMCGTDPGFYLNVFPPKVDDINYLDYLQFDGMKGQNREFTGYCTYTPDSDWCKLVNVTPMYRRVWHCMVENNPDWCRSFEVPINIPGPPPDDAPDTLGPS